ncbi:apoptosis stimulating of P53 [Echinococcus multilocularis]|uniref:Apoptosis stimulating of P53 n=1 Tax=Echinococcus multilocularis TaxID=6211 RepID=A0A068Y035_ECHMU|nr:apoptosis stimulating of P53 [Echinococcus multilocularis]
MPPVICSSNYPRQNHSTSYQTPISSEERAPAAPIPARRQFSNHHYHLPPNPPLQRLRSPPPPSQHRQQQQQPFPPLPTHQSQSHFTIQMPSSRGTAFKKLNNTAAPPPYDSLRSVIGNPANQRIHHATGPPLPVYFSPSLTASPTPQMRNRNATPNVGTPVGGAILPGAKKTSPLPSARLQHQRTEVLSPMYQLPEFVNSPPRNLEVSPKQKTRLNELRREKATYEQLWRKNNQLASSNSAMENQVTVKDRELKSCTRRSEELSTKLDIIRKWCEWLVQPPNSQLARPDRSPYFETNEDTTRWKRAFDELCRLDRKIGNLRSQRRSHPTVSRLNATRPSTTSSPAHFPPSELPPKPSTERSGRHSSAGAQKRDFTPTPSPRLNRPASAPVDKDAPAAAVAANTTKLSPPPPRPSLPAPSPILHKARFASRKEINATYLTPPQWRNEHTDEYKRTASENLQAQLASQQLQSIEVLLPEAKRLSLTDAPSSVSEVAIPYSEEDSTSAGSSSSSLETPKPVRKVIRGPGSRVFDGSEDSAIADTDGSPIVSQESPKKVRSEEGLNAGTKPILRKAVGDGEEVEERREEGEELKAMDKVDPGSPKTGVRFHPLALLLDAALEGDLALVKKAAGEVSDVSEANDEGITALHNAVCAGRVEVVEFLVREAGADVNAGDTDGWTPLHCAASCGNVRLARLLVEHGAALHARTLSDHETALEKCDQADADAECERYLSAELGLLGSEDSGRVFALFPRGLEAAGPGSPDANIEPDELPIWPNEELRIINRSPVGEPDWMLAEKVGGDGDTLPQRGLVPRAFISRFRIVRVPPASRPMPLPPPDSVGRFSRIFQSPSPIEEEEEDGQEDGRVSYMENESGEDNGSPQMVERAGDGDEEEEEEEILTVEVNNHDANDETDKPLNGSSDISSEEKAVRTAM